MSTPLEAIYQIGGFRKRVIDKHSNTYNHHSISCVQSQISVLTVMISLTIASIKALTFDFAPRYRLHKAHMDYRQTRSILGLT